MPTTYPEHLASAPLGVLEYRCLEIAHPLFDAPLLIYTPGHDDLTVTLETGAVATFKACPFRTAPPARDDSGRISRGLQIDASDGSLMRALLPAAQSLDPITATLRVYLSDDLSAPQFDPPEVLSLTNISIDKKQISAQAENEDIINKRFPTALYTTENTPGLKR